jgi:hypothetical protein
MTTALSKICAIFVGIMLILVNWFQCAAKGRQYVLGIIAGIALILLALFFKVSDTKRQKKP